MFLTPQFIRFLVAGGIALVANWCARIILNHFMSYELAMVLAYSVGMATAFVLNASFVFASDASTRHREMGRFVIVNLLMFPLVFATSWVLSEKVFSIWLEPAPARAVGYGIAIILPVFISFVAHKFFTFGETLERPDA